MDFAKISFRDVMIGISTPVYSLALITSPIWFTGATMATIMGNSTNHYKPRFQYGMILSVIAQPIALIYTLYKQISISDKSTLTATIPLIPLSTFVVSFMLFFNDKVDTNQRNK